MAEVKLEPGPIVRTPVKLRDYRKREIAVALGFPVDAVKGRSPALRIAATLLTRNFKRTPLGQDDFRLVGVEVTASTQTGETRLLEWSQNSQPRFAEYYKETQELNLSEAPPMKLVRRVSLDTNKSNTKVDRELNLLITYDDEVLTVPLDIGSSGTITGSKGTEIELPKAPREFTSNDSPSGHPAGHQVAAVARTVLKATPQYADRKPLYLAHGS